MTTKQTTIELGKNRGDAAEAAMDETIYDRSVEMQDCIDNCTDCAQVCEQMVNHCLSRGGRHAAPAHIRLLIDCAAACHQATSFMLRDSDFHHLTCGTCAAVCRACADDCDKLNDDELMKECIEICRRAAASCTMMAAMQ